MLWIVVILLITVRILWALTALRIQSKLHPDSSFLRYSAVFGMNLVFTEIMLATGLIVSDVPFWRTLSEKQSTSDEAN